ncbi:MAG: hypothetical protein ABI162_19905 [Luteolibacter sp.]
MLRSLSLLFTSTCLLHAGVGDFIRQIQNVNGNTVIYDIALSNDKGDVISKPLSAESAVFQLYALETANDGNQTFTKLDEDTVGTFLPQVTAQMLSEDPYPVPRTRADRPYGLKITIAGLSPDDPKVPADAKVYNAIRSYALYNPTTYQPNGTAGEYKEKYIFNKNGIFTDNGIIHMLPKPEDLPESKYRPTKACGEESFTMCTQTGTTRGSELAKATVQIWPVADCRILNLEEGKTYFAVPTNASIELRDLYPDSETKVQVYPGVKAPGTVGTVLPSSVVKFSTYLPQNANIVLSDLETSVFADGTYTLEVLTKTPFNDGTPEIIASISFTIKRTLKVNGMISTME